MQQYAACTYGQARLTCRQSIRPHHLMFARVTNKDSVTHTWYEVFRAPECSITYSSSVAWEGTWKLTAFTPSKLFLTLVATCQQGPQLLSLYPCLSTSLLQLQRSRSNKCPPASTCALHHVRSPVDVLVGQFVTDTSVSAETLSGMCRYWLFAINEYKTEKMLRVGYDYYIPSDIYCFQCSHQSVKYPASNRYVSLSHLRGHSNKNVFMYMLRMF